jgi:hypothetical protein
VVVVATGFAPSTAVTVALVGVETLDRPAADAAGRATYRFTVPQTLPRGQHALVFSGLPESLADSTDRGNLEVTVPLTEQWPFRTGGGPATPPSHGASGTGAHRDASRGGSTSATGVDVLLAAVAGLVVLLIGFVLTRAGTAQRSRAGGQ